MSTMAVHNRCCFRSRTPNRDGNGRSEMSTAQSLPKGGGHSRTLNQIRLLRQRDARIRDQAELKALRDEATLLRSEVKELKEVARHVVEADQTQKLYTEKDVMDFFHQQFDGIVRDSKSKWITEMHDLIRQEHYEAHPLFAAEIETLKEEN